MRFLNVVLIIVFSLYSYQGFSQKKKKEKTFEGHIFYTVTPQGEVDPSVSAQLPTAVNSYFKGTKTRMEQKTPMGTAIIIGNFETKEQIVLIDMMGQKLALRSSKEETEKALSEIPLGTFNMGTETKQIAGYTAKSAEFVQDGKTSQVFITDGINLKNSNWQTQYREIPGVVLEYTQIAGEEGEIKMLITASEVKKEKVKDTMFTIPTGYQEMSMAEFKKMFGGAN